MGYLKGKSSLMIFDRHANIKYKYGNRKFWCTGYYVDTVGRNKKVIEEYIKNQIQEVGDQRIILAVNKQNPSYHFYLSQGFKVYEEGVFDIGNGFVMDDYLMEWNA